MGLETLRNALDRGIMPASEAFDRKLGGSRGPLPISAGEDPSRAPKQVHHGAEFPPAGGRGGRRLSRIPFRCALLAYLSRVVEPKPCTRTYRHSLGARAWPVEEQTG